MATLSQQATVSAAQGCIARIDAGDPDHAESIAVFADGRALPKFTYRITGTPCVRVQAGQDAEGYVTLGKRVLDAPIGFAITFAQVIATQPGVQTGIGTSPTDGEDVTDEQLLSAVETIYSSFTSR